MSTTYKQKGDVLTLVAPVGGVTTGVLLLIGSILVVPKETAAQGADFDADVVGVHAYTKTASQAWSQGDKIYWNTSTAKFDSDPSTGPLVGIATEDVAGGAGDTTGTVRLGFAPAAAAAGVFHTRHRVTTAEVNAGHTLLPAQAGIKYRMIDSALIAYGGNAGTTTTVDILGTQSAAGVKLLAGAQANLTRSTLIRAGGTGGAILADGASFVACDVNTAITIGKTGGDLDTATGIDVLLTYAMDPG